MALELALQMNQAAVAAAVRLAGEIQMVPSGVIGGCTACGGPAVDHFGHGGWIGCPKGSPSTVFVLAAIVVGGGVNENGNGGGVAVLGEGAAATPVKEKRLRGFFRARYTTKLHHSAKPELLHIDHLTPTRMRALKVIHDAGKAGLLARDIVKRSKLPHGSVQQTLHWLREQQLVNAEKEPFHPSTDQ